MKTLKFIFWGLLIVAIVVYILPATLLQIPYIQNKISAGATEYLEKKLGTEVHINGVELGLFNKLILKDVSMSDQSGDTLFVAKRIGAGFEFLPLFQKKLRFSSVQLFTFNFNLTKETADSPLNIQYIIDAFRTDSKDNNSSIDLKIKNLTLRLGNFTYRIKDKALANNSFSANDMELSKISAKIHLDSFTENELNFQLNKLSFNEKSGFQLKSLSLDWAANQDSVRIKNLNLELPCSRLQSIDIQLDCSNKKKWDEMPFQLLIQPSKICPQDLSAIVPAFSHYEDKIVLQGKLMGTLADFSFKNVCIQSDKEFFIQSSGRIQNANHSNPEHIYIKSSVTKSTVNIQGIERVVSNLNGKEPNFPKEIRNLGNIFFSGELSGYLNHLRAHGEFNTDLGNLTANVIIGKDQKNFIKGQILTSMFDLKKLTDNDNWGQTAFNIDVDAVIGKSNQPSGHVKGNIRLLEYKGYKYENINLAGDFTKSGFNGTLDLENQDGKLLAKGSFQLNGKQSEFNFLANASNLHLDKLNLTKKYKNPLLSFSINAQFVGNNIDNLLGNITVHDLSFSTEKGVCQVDSFVVKAKMNDETKEIRVVSDILHGEIKGVYSLKEIVPEWKQVLSTYLPALSKGNTSLYKKEENKFSFYFIINNDKNMASVLELPFILYEPAQISGFYDNQNNEFLLVADVPYLNAGNLTVESGLLELKNDHDTAWLELKGIFRQKNNKFNINSSFKVENNTVQTLVSWDNPDSKKTRGKLNLTTAFDGSIAQHSLTADIRVKPSQLIFNDSVWTLYSTAITANAEKISIKDFKAQHANQIIKINGNISRDADDEAYIELNQVDLSYIFQTLAIKALDFGGIATGKVSAKDVYHTRQLTTDLDVTNFAFNKEVFGHLLLNGSWDDEKQGVKMRGSVFKNDTTGVKIDGMIYPVKEEISINFDTKNASAAFLRKYLNNVVQDFSGQVTGLLHLFGDLNHPTVEGTVDVKNGMFGIKFLNAYYTFSDKVVCAPDSISISNLTLYDENRNKATATGYVKHHLFDEFQFSVNVDFDHFMAFNATKASNPVFFGTSYGTGKLTLKGTEDLVNINVSMQNTENSKITLNFMEGANVAEYDFIHFINKTKDVSQSASTSQYLPIISNKPILIENNSQTEIRLSLSLGVTPNATIDLIMDPTSGDKISAYGNGRLDIQYGTSTPLKVMGNYTIEKGKYNFSLQQVILRNFDIKEGSSVQFKGNPYAAELDLSAAYTVSANLGDLDERLFMLSARNNVPINCILLLKGAMSHPNIAFDLDLPGATAELVRQVKSYIRTDDMMNRQILYLLVLGRFYTTPEFGRSDSRLNNDLSFLTSTLSSQLSNILSSLSNNFQIGTVFHQAYEGEKSRTEIELLLSSTLLNNRLTINGNFGYTNNPSLYGGEAGAIQSNNGTPLVGDLNVEYKLTPNGNIRLKGFNHYNYRNYYSISPELTQGIGILYRKDFNHIYDLFEKKKKSADIEKPEQK